MILLWNRSEIFSRHYSINSISQFNYTTMLSGSIGQKKLSTQPVPHSIFRTAQPITFWTIIQKSMIILTASAFFSLRDRHVVSLLAMTRKEFFSLFTMTIKARNLFTPCDDEQSKEFSSLLAMRQELLRLYYLTYNLF